MINVQAKETLKIINLKFMAMKDFILLFISFFPLFTDSKKRCLVKYVQSFHEDDDKRLKFRRRLSGQKENYMKRHKTYLLESARIVI